MVKDYCDNCSNLTDVKRLELGGGAGVHLCRRCHAKEMVFRKYRNKTLAKDVQFDIKGW